MNRRILKFTLSTEFNKHIDYNKYSVYKFIKPNNRFINKFSEIVPTFVKFILFWIPINPFIRIDNKGCC